MENDSRHGNNLQTYDHFLSCGFFLEENPSPTAPLRLFECISVMKKKGSPEGYYAETGDEAPTQKAHSGEAHECDSLYRIRCTQETCQLLCQNGEWRDRRGRQTSSTACGSEAVGHNTAAALARSDGSDAVQCLDLRHAEAVWRAPGDGTSGKAEGHHRRQEEERQNRRAHDCRPAALQLVTRLLRQQPG